MGQKLGGGLLCPFFWGSGSPCNTMWPGPRSTSVPSGIVIHPANGSQRMGQKKGGGCCAPFIWQGEAGSPSNTMSPGLWSTSVPSGILIHPGVWPHQTWAINWGEGWSPFGGQLVPCLTQCGRGSGLPPCQVSSWSIQPFGQNTPTSWTGQTGQTTVR